MHANRCSIVGRQTGVSLHDKKDAPMENGQKKYRDKKTETAPLL